MNGLGRINSITIAYKNYLAAANAVLALYRSEGGCHTDATNQALVKFTEERRHFLSACVSTEGFVITMKERSKVLEGADETKARDMVLGYLHHMRTLLTLSDQTLTSCFGVMADQATKLERELFYLEDFIQDGDEAHVTGQGNTAALPALAGFDIKSASTEDTESHNTAATLELKEKKAAAPRETMGPGTATPNTGLSEPGPQNAA